MKLARLLVLGCAALLAWPAAAQTTALDPTFQRPVILNGTSAGTVYEVVQQPDGKYVIGGTFTSINGTPASNLARLNADGTLDASFTARSTTNGPVYALALQPDGGVLVGGQFDRLAAGQRRSVGRLLATGLLDAGFDAGLGTSISIRQVGLLPGGDVLALTPQGATGNSMPLKGLYRLNGQTGQEDFSFQQAVQASCFAVQADGRIVTGGGNGSYVLMHLLARLLPTGSLDPAYTPSTTYYTSNTYQVEVTASNTIYRLGDGNTLRGLTGPGIGQNDWGALNPHTFQRQPNGRFLVAGSGTATQPATARLLPNGQQDASYQPAAGPVGPGEVMRILVQPDGALLMAGSFTLAGTTPVHGLVRLRDANVLPTRGASPAAAATAAWPVPATDVLHVQLATAARPQQLTLLDYLGRPVLAHPVAAGTAALDLDVAALPAGVYMLRVSYGTEVAPVTRSVVLAR